MNRLLNYFRATRGELRHVSWPTQKQTIIYTLLVISVSLVTAVYLGLLDSALKEVLRVVLPGGSL